MDTGFRLWPESASTFSSSVDQLYIFLLLVAGFFTVLIAVLIWFFALRYRVKAQVDRTPPKELLFVEIGWSVVPFVLTMVMFVWGAVIFFDIYTPPKDADQITVVGKQWMWKIQHPNGKREINALHVPVGRPVRLKMISEDVIHSFYVPAFRVKQDVLPGRYTTMWFEPTKVGVYHLFCAEYCGTSHSGMRGTVVVMEPADYAEWLAGGASDVPAEVAGEQLFQQFTCGSCHSAASDARCPPLDGILGQRREFDNAEAVEVDDEYLRESILNPQAKIVKGYAGRAIMPTYQGQIGEDGVLQLIAYLKSLGQPATDAAAPSPEGDETSPAGEKTPDVDSAPEEKNEGPDDLKSMDDAEAPSSADSVRRAKAAAERQQEVAWGASPRYPHRNASLSFVGATATPTRPYLSPLRGLICLNLGSPGANAPGYSLPSLRDSQTRIASRHSHRSFTPTLIATI